jgi:hypothetical protein
MSVSASVVRKIMRGSVWARIVTDCLVGFAVVGVLFNCVLMALGGIRGQKVLLGPYVISSAALQPWSTRVYVMLMMSIIGAIWIGSLYMVRSVFADLARGNIFCEANVRRIRNLGWLTIAGGIFGLLLPAANAAYLMVAGEPHVLFENEPPFADGLGQLVNGGLYLLLSWIMAVGLGVREDAEELQREAELVV